VFDFRWLVIIDRSITSSQSPFADHVSNLQRHYDEDVGLRITIDDGFAPYLVPGTWYRSTNRYQVGNMITVPGTQHWHNWYIRHTSRVQNVCMGPSSQKFVDHHGTYIGNQKLRSGGVNCNSLECSRGFTPGFWNGPSCRFMIFFVLANRCS
jgi:hypothetical protein